MKILYLNPLDARHGSTYRARSIVKGIWEIYPDALYIEGLQLKAVNKSGAHKVLGLQEFKQRMPGVLGALLPTLMMPALLKRLDFDVLWMQKFLPVTWPLMLSARRRNKTIIVDWDDLDAQLQKNWWRRRLVAAAEMYLPKNADVITTHSPGLADLARERSRAKVYLLKQTIDAELFHPDCSPDNQIPIPAASRGKVFGFLCTLNKGGAGDLDIILRSFEAIKAKDPAAFLLIIGGGEYERSMWKYIGRKGLQNNVLITGLVPQENIPAVLKRVDYGLVYLRDNPANRLRVSFKVMEYLALGLPVIARLVGESERLFGRYLAHRAADETEFSAGLIQALDGHLKGMDYSAEIRNNYDWKTNLPVIKEALSHGQD